MAVLAAAASRRHSLLHLLARRHGRSLSSAADDSSTPPPISATTAKHRIRRSPDPDKAVSVFSAIAASPSPPPASYAFALDLTVRRLARSRRSDEIIALLDSHKSSPHASHEPFLADLIHAYGTAAMLDRALSLFEQFPSPTVLSFNAVLSACMRAKKYSRVPQLFTDLSAAHSISPDSISYAMLIKSLCIRGESAAALEKISEMRDKKITPTARIYTVLLTSFYKEGKLEEAEKIWTQMSQPDLVAYNAKALYLSRHGRPEELRAVIAEMESAGLKPDTSTHNHLITSYCKSGRVQDAKDVYYERGWERNATTYNSFVYLLCESGDLEGALGVFNDGMKRKKILPDFGATSVLVEKLVKESRAEEARAVLGKVRRKLPKAVLRPWEELEKKLGLAVVAGVSEKSEAA